MNGIAKQMLAAAVSIAIAAATAGAAGPADACYGRGLGVSHGREVLC